jgi:hypothetical protein
MDCRRSGEKRQDPDGQLSGVNIDVPADKVTPVGNFSIFFSQTGGYSTQAGNTAPQRHPTGVFIGTTGTGSTPAVTTKRFKVSN